MPRVQPLLSPLFRKWPTALLQGSALRACSYAASPGGLASIMKLESIDDKDPDEVSRLWQEFHDQSQSDIVGGMMSGDDYHHFATRTAASPRFVLPLSKFGGGYHTFFLQAQLPHVLLTPLEQYKHLGAAAPVQLTLTHFTELRDSKNLVLVRGTIHDRSLTKAEARTLMELTRAYYLDPLAFVDVHNFNHDQAKFDFSNVLKELNLNPNSKSQIS